MTTVRESLNSAFEEVMPEEGVTPAAEVPAGTDTGKIEQTAIPAEAKPEEPKAGRTAGRPRDENGRLLPGKPAKPAAAAPGSPAAGVTAPEQPQAPAVARPARPSSWKKDYWDHWEKLDPKLAEYLVQRENEFAKGVSTYKQEWDNAKPLLEAMTQFSPLLQQHGIRPEQWITNLGNAHKTLALGTPQQKLSAFVKLATDYQIPLNEMVVQGQDGKLYINPNIPAQQQAPQAQPQGQDVEKMIEEKLLAREVSREIQTFIDATDEKGQKKHPHFEAVRETMIGLLQANLATDPKDAYDQALRLPRHSDLYAQIQAQEQAALAEKKAQEQQAAVARARGKAVSAKPSTPTTSGEAKPKGVRGAIESAWDEHVGTGRV